MWNGMEGTSSSSAITANSTSMGVPAYLSECDAAILDCISQVLIDLPHLSGLDTIRNADPGRSGEKEEGARRMLRFLANHPVPLPQPLSSVEAVTTLDQTDVTVLLCPPASTRR